MIEKLKELYEYLPLDYNQIELYFKNCIEIGDWYFLKLQEIYEKHANLPTTVNYEECHGIHRIEEYTDYSLDEINLFLNNMKKLLKDYGNINDNNTNS